mgnify:CR=1 FL=1
MKTCTSCNIGKSKEKFWISRGGKDWLKSHCKDCANKKSSIYKKTKNGLITSIFWNQRASSKRRWHELPLYSKQEFKNWVFNQDNFLSLYDEWVKSWYKRSMSPSVDRLDDSKWYSFGNIQLMTWWENHEKWKKGMRDWDIMHSIKPQRAVTQINMETWEETTFHSTIEASRKTGASQPSISHCCRWKIKTTGGFMWKYA